MSNSLISYHTYCFFGWAKNEFRSNDSCIETCLSGKIKHLFTNFYYTCLKRCESNLEERISWDRLKWRKLIVWHRKDSSSPWRFDVLVMAIRNKLFMSHIRCWCNILYTSSISSFRLLSFIFFYVMNGFDERTWEEQDICPTKVWWGSLVMNISGWSSTQFRLVMRI